MTTNGKQPLVEIERLLKRYRATLANAAETVRTQDVSNYPIFVASKEDIDLGVSLLLRGTLPDDWSVNASTLEEFHAKRIIDVEKIDDFRTLYRKHSDEICVFVFMNDGGAKFVFIPA
jgi:hypothetical protein